LIIFLSSMTVLDMANKFYDRGCISPLQGVTRDKHLSYPDSIRAYPSALPNKRQQGRRQPISGASTHGLFLLEAPDIDAPRPAGPETSFFNRNGNTKCQNIKLTLKTHK
jgi:hypothetical protein